MPSLRTPSAGYASLRPTVNRWAAPRGMACQGNNCSCATLRPVQIALKEGGSAGFTGRDAIMQVARLAGSSAGKRKLSLLFTFGLQARQEHQVGRFLGIHEKRLARSAYLRTHGKAAGKIRHLDRAYCYWKLRWDFSSVHRIAETAFHKRYAASQCVLQELPDLRVVYQRRDTHE
jgi:hypothetical protein